MPIPGAEKDRAAVLFLHNKKKQLVAINSLDPFLSDLPWAFSCFLSIVLFILQKSLRQFAGWVKISSWGEAFDHPFSPGSVGIKAVLAHFWDPEYLQGSILGSATTLVNSHLQTPGIPPPLVIIRLLIIGDQSRNAIIIIIRKRIPVAVWVSLTLSFKEMTTCTSAPGDTCKSALGTTINILDRLENIYNLSGRNPRHFPSTR